MKEHLRPALSIFLLLTLITGFAYPLCMTGLAALIPGERATGSPVVSGKRIVGSRLLGQEFTNPGYFWGRLSATGPKPYTSFDAAAGTGSSGSNMGPLNPALKANAEARIAALRAADPDNSKAIPVDLVTASASGLDPHITVAGAEFQVARVARARGAQEATVRALVAGHTEGRTLGILGEPRVNVLALNLALDEQLGPLPAAAMK